MTLRIEDTVWVAPGIPATAGDLEVISLGWFLHEGELRPANPAVEVGAQYLVALGRFESAFAPLRPPSIRVAGGRLSAGRDAALFYEGPWTEALNGLTLDEVKAAIQATPADELARAYADLPLEARVPAIREARRASAPAP